MKRRSTCPITDKDFNCHDCTIPHEGKCPYMKFDDCVDEALRIARRIAEDEREK